MRKTVSILKTLFDFLLMPRCLHENRDLLVPLIRRNVEVRYRGSILGLLWSFAQPLIMLCVYTFVFSVVFKMRWGDNVGESKAEFAVIMFCGMAIFNIFSESVSTSCGVIVNSPNYVKKVIFPLETLPVAQVFSTLIVGMAWFVLLFFGTIAVYREVYWTMLLLPLVLIPLTLFTMGISLFVASLGVYIRDVQHMIGVLLQVLFFMTPIFYPISRVPEKYQWVLKMNPLTIIIEEARKIFLRGELPDWTFLLISTAVGLLVCHLGFVWFTKTKKGFADVL